MDTLCRLCMNVCSVGMEPIFRSVMARCLATKIIGVTQLTIYEGDGLPANVCQQCIFKLDMSDNFIQKCILSDKAFRAMQVVQNAIRPPPRIAEEKVDGRQLVDYHSEDQTMSVAHQPKNVLRYARLNKEPPKGGNDNNFRISIIQTIKLEDSDQSNSSAADGVDMSTTSKHSNQNLGKPNVNNSLLEKGDQGPDNNSVSRNDGVCNVGESGTDTDIGKVVGAAKHKCDVCQREFASKSGLISHTKRHKAERSRLLAKETRARKLLQKIPGKGKKTNATANKDVGASAKHPCGICDRTFDTALGLANHSLGHSGKRPMFSCDLCPKKFVQTSHLNRHKQKHVGKQRTESFECDVCRKKFRTKKTLTEHILKHVVARPFNCAECDMCFATPHTLSAHMFVHATDRPHKCELCEKAFKRKSYLACHMERHAASEQKSSKDSFISTVQSCVSAVYAETSNESLSLESSKPNHKIFRKKSFLLKDSFEHFNLQGGVDPKRFLDCHEDMGETLFSCEDTVIYLDEGADPEVLPNSHEDHNEENLSSCIDPLSNNTDMEPILECHEDTRNRSFSCKDTVKSFDEDADHGSLPDSKAHIRENLFMFQDPLSNGTDLESILECHEVLCKDSVESVSKVSDLESLIPRNVVASDNYFPCEVCGRRFTSRPSVEQHMIVHFRAARHKCSKCARCFQTSLGLKDHMKFHEEGHQFMCSICSVTFTGEDGLQAHLLNHTNEFNVAKS